jgi:hypothetical protein
MVVESLTPVTEPSDEYGVKESPVFDCLIVDRDATPDKTNPRPDIADLSPGDTVAIHDTEFRVPSTGKHIRRGQKYIYRFSVPPDAFGTVATVYVDRDPYLLDVCNGGIYPVDPDAVTVAPE